ncbi:MAG TPA: ABC-F family ATP-binding cassette domain-containing protein [Anaerolineaceae bacterium]|nr:ABC-F family ATP-binding cassette domain-containing protein [Anaerolineaceae bacterium]HPN52085.1 ABC-F family ATP-binding cassette domain-containing protein [Anaerolineaceae bacterium]
MPVLSATNISKSFGAEDIFSHISLSVPHRARIALVGANGIGKTTLLRILIGLEEPSSGEIQRARSLKIGYLPQEARFESERTLWEECLAAFNDLLDMQTELHGLEAAMSNPDEADAALERYGKVQMAFERRGGYTYENRIRMTLTGLGFGPQDIHRPIDQLSGGQHTRAFLARLLLTDPDLLLLDEPTNHLDIQAVEWLEAYLKEWDGAVLIVSHDRYFLDQVADHIWEMTPALEVYRGNYSAYLKQRTERYQRRLEEYQAQAAFIEKEEDYIRRNIAGQNTRQAQGRRRRLERLLEEARLTPPTESRSMTLHFQPVARSGDLVMRTHNLSVGYHDEGRPLFRVDDLVLRRGECAAIIGPNGAGKTTFLKTILEQIPAYEGETELGASLEVGYFAQAHEGLKAEHDLMEEIAAAAPQMLPADIRSYLARFLFTGDDVFKKVDMLSGGERGRLALAKLALSSANLLLLDEPTNHLDLHTQEVMQSVLGDYRGTILLVSHDRYLIDALATQIWEVDPQEGVLRIFEGTYSQYHAAREVEMTLRATRMAAAVAAPPISAPPRPKQPARPSITNAERKRQRRLEELEAEITAVENQVNATSRQLENPPADPGRVQKLGQDYLALQDRLEKLMEEWEQLQQPAA